MRFDFKDRKNSEDNCDKVTLGACLRRPKREKRREFMSNQSVLALKQWASLRRDTRAVTAIEYGLIAALIFLAIVSAVTTVQNNVVALWVTIAAKI